MMSGKYLNFGSNAKIKFKNITLQAAQNGRLERDSTSDTKENKSKKKKSNEAQSRLIDYYCQCCNK